MASNIFGGLRMDSISKNASKKDVKTFLSAFTDEDFNGNNGEDYYIEVDYKGKNVLMSNLDACMINFDKYDNLEKFISYVLSCNYGDDGYYVDYGYQMMTFGDDLVLSLATSYYN